MSKPTHGGFAGIALTDIARIELEAIANAPGLFRGEEEGARTGEAIEDDVTAPRAVLDGIGDQCDGLHGRMCREVL